VSLYRTIFPQMTIWLLDEERSQLRFEFEVQIARLEAPELSCDQDRSTARSRSA
jgi:hypothetical protein